LQLYATAFGSVVGLDYRQQRPAFKFENDLRSGIQTAFAVSPGTDTIKYVWVIRCDFYCLGVVAWSSLMPEERIPPGFT
jgi:hypothetical protein